MKTGIYFLFGFSFLLLQQLVFSQNPKGTSPLPEENKPKKSTRFVNNGNLKIEKNHFRNFVLWGSIEFCILHSIIKGFFLLAHDHRPLLLGGLDILVIFIKT